MNNAKNKNKYYKKDFFIVFYDKEDNYLMYMFDNVREILEFINKPITRTNVNLIDIELYNALKSKTHLTRMLNGQLLRVYIIKND